MCKGVPISAYKEKYFGEMLISTYLGAPEVCSVSINRRTQLKFKVNVAIDAGLEKRAVMEGKA